MNWVILILVNLLSSNLNANQDGEDENTEVGEDNKCESRFITSKPPSDQFDNFAYLMDNIHLWNQRNCGKKDKYRQR